MKYPDKPHGSVDWRLKYKGIIFRRRPPSPTLSGRNTLSTEDTVREESTKKSSSALSNLRKILLFLRQRIPTATMMDMRNTPSNQPSANGIIHEVWMSSELLFSNKLSWLLILGPVALLGDSTGLLGEAACFALSGIALIPCAER